MKPAPKPEFTQSCLEIATELTEGPCLLDDRGHPTDAVERYTGARLIQKEDRCLVAGALRILEYSDRQIAEALHCDVRSIPLMLRAAEKTGRIPALKDRLSQLTGTNAERAQIALGNLLEKASTGNGDMDLAAMIKAVATAGGIATQNLQLLTGGPTEILQLQVGAGREEIEAWARSLAVPVEATVISEAATPIDSEATGTGTKPLQIEGLETGGHVADTSEGGKARAKRAADGGGGGPVFDAGGGGAML